MSVLRCVKSECTALCKMFQMLRVCIGLSLLSCILGAEVRGPSEGRIQDTDLAVPGEDRDDKCKMSNFFNGVTYLQCSYFIYTLLFCQDFSFPLQTNIDFFAFEDMKHNSKNS